MMEQMMDPIQPDTMPPGEAQGYAIVLTCYPDGRYDVVRTPMESMRREEDLDGLYGLDSLEDALKGVIALTREKPGSVGHEAMMGAYRG